VSEDPAAGTEIPFAQLTPEALTGVLESFVLREGTDYVAVELSLAGKVAQLRAAVERGEARIVFDPETETVTILPTR
jgi:uncharacterized protein YheU (UPF0270 family)